METINKKDLFLKLRAWLSGATIYSIGLLIYLKLPYYQSFISKSFLNINFLHLRGFGIFYKGSILVFGTSAFSLLCSLYIFYVVFSFFWFFFYSGANIKDSRALVFWQAIIKIILGWKNFFSKYFDAGLPSVQISPQEKSTVLFFLVKLIYIPIMANFFFGNIGDFFTNVEKIFSHTHLRMQGQISEVYFCVFYAILIIDTTYFLLGYLFEFKSWKNELRSVEPTLFGWIVALACYPPFNNITTQIFGWGSNDYSAFPFVSLTIIAAIVSIVLYMIYVWATIALGLKASNLTNRGIVSRGPYKYVRHPAYISKNLAWLIMGIPIVLVNPLAIFSIAAWASIYFLRALTEERHLLADPDYQEYCKKVPYRFIPGVI